MRRSTRGHVPKAEGNGHEAQDGKHPDHRHRRSAGRGRPGGRAAEGEDRLHHHAVGAPGGDRRAHEELGGARARSPRAQGRRARRRGDLRGRSGQARRRQAGRGRNAEKTPSPLRVRHHLVERHARGRADGHRGRHVHDRDQRRPARTRRQDVQRAVLQHFLAERRDARGDGESDAGPGHRGRVRHGAELRRGQGHGDGLQALLQRAHRRRGLYAARADRLPGGALPAALQEPEGGVRLLPGRHGEFVPQAVLRGGAARTISAVFGLHGGRDLDPGGEARRARPVGDALLEPRPQEPGEPEVRLRLPQEVRQDAGVLRCAELRRHHADRFGGARRQGRSRRQEGHDRGDAQGEFRLHARQVLLQHQPLPDPELLPAQGGCGAGRRGPGDGDPEDGVHQPQGLLHQGMRDEVVAAAALLQRYGGAADRAPFVFHMNIVLVLEQTLNGLQLGVMLFLMAAGLTLVFGIMNLVNLAHGSFYMVGAYLATYFYQVTGSYLLGVLLGLAGTLVVGIVVELVALRTLYERDHLDQVLATFGLILFFNELMAILWGRAAIYATIPDYLSGHVELFAGLRYPLYRLVIIAVGLAVAGLLWFVVARTRLGMLIRAGASNRAMVAALGVNIRLLYTLVFGFGAALAGLAGLMAGPIHVVQPGMGELILIEVFVVIVIGGIGSIRGALAGALIVGMVDTLGRAFVRPMLATVLSPSAADTAGPALASMLIYLLMAIVLALRPQGLFPARS